MSNLLDMSKVRQMDLFNNGLTGPLNGPADQTTMAQWMLRNAGTDPKTGDFSLDRLMKFWQSRSPESQTHLSGKMIPAPVSVPGWTVEHPELSEDMSRLSQLYNATGQSRSLLGEETKNVMTDPASAAATALGIGKLVTGGHGAVAALAEPAIMGGLAYGAQRLPGAAQWLAGKSAGSLSDVMLGGVPQSSYLFPDSYTPEAQQPDQVVPKNIRTFLSEGDPQQVAAFVSNKLGPQVAAQLPAPTSAGYRGALQNLMLQPQYRKLLTATSGQ
jgi:hypothetical protein